MVARILMRSIALAGAVLVLVGAALAFAWGGAPVALGFGAGGLLALLSGLGLVFLASRLMAGGSTPGLSPGAAGGLLVVKGLAVLAVAWTLLAAVRVDALGFLFGLGAGVLAVVVGAQLGQGSPEGQAAIRAEEARLAAADRAAGEEGGDSEAKTG